MTNNEDYEVPEYVTIEEYVQEARDHPEHLNGIIRGVFENVGHSVKPFVDEFGFDVNTPVVYIKGDGPHPVICHALAYANVEEVEYLMSVGAALPEDTLDWLFNGTGGYYTWENCCFTRAQDISKIIDMIGVETLHSFMCADWWYEDFVDYVRYSKKEGNDDHSYLQFENIREVLHMDEINSGDEEDEY